MGHRHLIVLAVTLTVLAGVTGRATTGGGLIRQILWITVTAILTLIAVATVWTIASRYLPIPELENAPAKPRRPPAPVPEPGHGGTHTTMVTMGKRDTME